MSKYVTLNPSQRPTVAAVGEFAYKDALRRVPAGKVMLEVVPEPDNPYDSQAISIRYNGSVIGYIPRGRTKTYWPVVARVAESGKIARVQGKVYSNPSADYFEVTVHLLAGDKALEGVVGLVSKSSSYSVPDSFSKDPSRKSVSGVTFTQAEIDAEIARRRGGTSSPSPELPTSRSTLGNDSLGCTTSLVASSVLFLILLIPILLLVALLG